MNIVTPNGSSTVTFRREHLGRRRRATSTPRCAPPASRCRPCPDRAGVDQFQPDERRYGSSQTFTVTGGAAVGLDGTATTGWTPPAPSTVWPSPATASRSHRRHGALHRHHGRPARGGGGTVTGTFDFTNGLAGLLSTRCQRVQQRVGPWRQGHAQDQIDDLQKRVTAWDDTLAQREETMRTKFTAMQVALDKLNAMSTSFANLSTSSS